MNLAVILLLFATSCLAAPPAAAQKYRGPLTREAHFFAGLDAPIPMYAGQIEQESGWRPEVTSYDNGKGLAQFTGGTTDYVGVLFPELGKSNPYNPVWSMRAMIRYDQYLFERVRGIDDCQRRAASLTAYNGGLGYVIQREAASPASAVWFGVTEFVPTRQSKQNWEASRMYPRRVLLMRQKNYEGWGMYLCKEIVP